MYQKWLDGDEDIASISKEEDPFWEPTEDVLIGCANVFLQSLAYALDFDDRLSITDYKGQEEGYLYVNVAPCTQKGKPLDEDYFVDNPSELLGKPYYFQVGYMFGICHVRYVNCSLVFQWCTMGFSDQANLTGGVHADMENFVATAVRHYILHAYPPGVTAQCRDPQVTLLQGDPRQVQGIHGQQVHNNTHHQEHTVSRVQPFKSLQFLLHQSKPPGVL